MPEKPKSSKFAGVKARGAARTKLSKIEEFHADVATRDNTRAPGYGVDEKTGRARPVPGSSKNGARLRPKPANMSREEAMRQGYDPGPPVPKQPAQKKAAPAKKPPAKRSAPRKAK